MAIEDWKPNRRTVLKAMAGTLGGAVLSSSADVVSTVSSPTQSLQHQLLEYDAVGLAQLIRTKTVSAKEVVNAAITRIEALDPDINALTTKTFDRALDRLSEIPADSLFQGVPTLLKDLIDLGGVRRTNGSRLNLTNIPEKSVAYVEAMERAGLSILGMTNTPEYASGALTDNIAFGATNNPWDLARNAGGSSGGSAAAVAAGYVPLAQGTDGGGSNRIPASCCGILGMKASRYRQVSGEADGGHYFLRTHQCLSRTVRDSAVLLAATENPLNRAGYAPVGLVEGASKRRLRIAVSTENSFGEQPEDSVLEVLNTTISLCESLGHEVVLVSNPVVGEHMFPAAEGIMLAPMPGLIAQVESMSGKRVEETGLLTKATIDMARYSQSLARNARQQGLDYFGQLTRDFDKFFETYDLWLTPTIPVESPQNGYITHDSAFELALMRNRQLLGYTLVANGIGAPAMSVPLFHSSKTGLPIGSHFMAAPGADRMLYELAFELESAQPWKQRWAPHSAMHLGQ
jgi:amidase